MCYYFIPLTHLLLSWLYTIFNSFCCWFLLVWSFFILSCSIFETSPPPWLWNVITWQRVISANWPQFWIVGAAFKVPEQVTILWRECFLNICKSSVTGRRSGLLSSSCRLFLVSDSVIVLFNFKYPQLSDILCNGVSRLSTVFLFNQNVQRKESMHYFFHRGIGYLERRFMFL